MNAWPAKFLPIGRGALTVAAATMLAGAAFAASPPTIASPSPVTTNAMAGAEAESAYPTFEGIPPTPKDVRSFDAWKASIADIKAVGVDMNAAAAAEPWTLSDTEAWAAHERATATPPPPVTTADDASTDAIVAQMRERAKQPPRSR
jgi:hypothetical protein